MAFKAALGIEIQEEGLCAVLLKAGISGVRIVSSEKYLFGPEIRNEERIRITHDFLKSFQKKTRASFCPLYIVAPSSWAIKREIEVPSVLRENLREAIGYEMEKYTPFSYDGVWYDQRILAEDKERDTIKVLLTAIKKENISPYFHGDNGLGNSSYGLETISTALANAFLEISPCREDEKTYVLYPRRGRLEVLVLEGQELRYERSVEIPTKIENISGLAMSELTVASRVCGHSKDGMDGIGVILLGSQNWADSMAELGRQKGISELRVTNENTLFPDLELLPAYGAALKGLKRPSIELNLLPSELRKKPSRTALYTMYLMIALVFTMAATWGLGYFANRRAEMRALDAKVRALATEYEVIQRLIKEKQALESRLKVLEEFKNKRGSAIEVLRELTERIPKTAWISNLSFSDKGVEIEGYADSASELIPLLDTSPMFKDVGFLSSITKAQGKERFRIGLKQVTPASTEQSGQKKGQG